MTVVTVLAALVVITTVDALFQRLQKSRLTRILRARTKILNDLLGDPHGQDLAEEVTDAREALEQAVRRLNNSGIRERLDQEERRA